MRVMPVILVAALAACAPQGSEPAPGGGDAATAPMQAGQPYDLRGEWSVARLNGQPLDTRIPFTASSDTFTWEPACAGQQIAYRTVDGRIEFYQPPREGERIVCDIGYPEPLPRVIEGLEGRWDVEQKGNGNLVLTRGETRLELEKAPAQPQVSLAGEWRVAGIDGREFNESYGLALSADESELWWEPRCAGVAVEYRIEGTRFSARRPAVAPPPAAGSAEPPAAPAPAVCAIGLPERLEEVMAAIRAADRIERTQANGVLISGNGRSVTLFGQ